MGIIFFIFPFFVFAAVDEYSAFSVRGVLGKDGALSVNEQFIYDYGDQPRHGLYRNIPLILKEGGAKFDIQSVTAVNKDGTPYLQETVGGGNTAQIKIGSPSVTLTGTHYYNVNYQLTGVGGTSEAEWRITNPIREHIAKLQADIYFPIPIPLQLATGTCAFVPDRNNSGCVLEPLLEQNYVAGYRISHENIDKEEISVIVNYPKGLIIPSIVQNKQVSARKYLIPIAITAGILLLLTIVLWMGRKHLKRWMQERKKPLVHPGEYSYLARAIAYKNTISRDDVIMTIADLAERGFVTISPIARPVGIDEFIDYSVEVLATEHPRGAEDLLLKHMDGGVDSLADWILRKYPLHAEEIVALAIIEVEGVHLLEDEEANPWPIGFK